MKKLKFIIPVLIVIMLIYFLGGYRFTALSAAKSNVYLPKDAQLMEQYDSDSSVIFLFKSDKEKMYRTVLAEKKAFFYQSRLSTYIPYNSDEIQTVGGISYTTKNNMASLLSVISYDEEVAYIEAGIEPYRESKEIKKGELTTFLFSTNNQIDQLHAVATNKEGEALYYYGYPKNAPTINLNKDLKWYKIDR